jgi:hypothetical protein
MEKRRPKWRPCTVAPAAHPKGRAYPHGWRPRLAKVRHDEESYAELNDVFNFILDDDDKQGAATTAGRGVPTGVLRDKFAGSTRSRSSGNTPCVTYLGLLFMSLVLLMTFCTR